MLEYRSSRDEMKFKDKFETIMKKNGLQFEGIDTSKISYLAQKKQLKQKCLNDLKFKCEQLEKKKKEIDNNLSEIETKFKSCEEELTTVESSIEAKREEFSASDTTIKDLKEQATSLKQEIEEKSISLQNVNNEIFKIVTNSNQKSEQNTFALSELRYQLELKNEEMSNLTKKLQELEQREQDEMKNLEKVELDLSKSLLDLKSHETQRDEKKEELEKKKSSLSLLQEQLDLLRDQERRQNSILSEKQIMVSFVSIELIAH